MAARDAVKRVPEIARNHCPSSAKCAVRGITHPEPTIPVPAPQPEPMRTPVEVAPAPAPGPTPAPVIAASEVARERTPKRPPAPAPRPESAKKPQKTPIVRQILTVIGDFADDPLGIKRRRAHKRKDAEVKRAQTIAHNKKIYEAWTRRIKSDPDMIAGDLHWAIAGRSAFADVFDHKALGLPATTSDAMRKRICEFAMDVKSERERAEYVARGRASSAPEPSRMQEIKRTRSRDTSALGDEWWLSNKSGPER